MQYDTIKRYKKVHVIQRSLSYFNSRFSKPEMILKKLASLF